MNGVVYTAVAGAETAQQGGISGIDDSICFQTGNVPPPKNDPRMTRNFRETAAVYYTFFFPFRRQQFILHSKKILFQRHGRADIHQTAEQLPLAGCVLPKFPRLQLVFRHFCQQLYTLLWQSSPRTLPEGGTVQNQLKKNPAVMSR